MIICQTYCVDILSTNGHPYKIIDTYIMYCDTVYKYSKMNFKALLHSPESQLPKSTIHFVFSILMPQFDSFYISFLALWIFVILPWMQTSKINIVIIKNINI